MSRFLQTKSARITLALIAILALSALLFLPLLNHLGIWDPHELTLADLACRKAGLVCSDGTTPANAAGGATNLNSMHRGYLMVQTVALAFKWFGRSDFSGRIALALWTIFGTLLMTAGLARLTNRRTALYCAIAYITMPVIVTNSRLIFGDAITYASFGFALVAFSVAVFGRVRALESAAWFVVGIVGTLALCGARGMVFGFVPALTVGLTFVLMQASSPDSIRLYYYGAALTVAVAVILSGNVAESPMGWFVHFDLHPTPDNAHTLQAALGFSWPWALAVALIGGVLGALLPSLDKPLPRIFANALLAIGATSLVVAFLLSMQIEPSPTNGIVPAMQAAATHVRKYPTFDLPLRQIAHAAFPWSAFAPFALGLILFPRQFHGPTAPLRMVAVIGATLAYAVCVLAAPRFGILPFAGYAALAIAIGLALTDLETFPMESLVVAIGAIIIGAIILDDYFFADLARSPVELATAPALTPYGILGQSLPDELREKNEHFRHAIEFMAAAFFGPLLFVWMDTNPTDKSLKLKAVLAHFSWFVTAIKHPYRRWWIIVGAVAELGLMALGLLFYKRVLRHIVFGSALFGKVNPVPAEYWWDFVNAWWIVLALLVFAYPLFLAIRWVFRLFGDWRVATIGAGAVAAAMAWSFKVMPAVADQFSPRESFLAYRQYGADAPIGFLGVSTRTAAYDLGQHVLSQFNEPGTAMAWFDSPIKRFLVLKTDNLPEMNHRWRQRFHRNLPVVQGRSSQVLLAGNQWGGANNNPLNWLVLDEPPTASTKCNDPKDLMSPFCRLTHTLDCNIDDKLACVGWDMLDSNGKPVTSVTSGETVKLRVVYRVTAAMSMGWKIFIHVEQPGTATARKTSDHDPLNAKYPLDKWQPGDIVVDDSDFSLEPNMTPGFPIKILTGFFSDKTRLHLISGPDAGPEQEGLRLVLGDVPVQ